jgi:phosphoribosyl 1,2-cyclic phosphodiesterase
MRIRIWGCRGSLATPGPGTVRVGGNTSCVEVRTGDDDLIILDAGTGLRPLGLNVAAEDVRTVHILLSHLHLDHLEGLGFFAPLWNPKVEIHFWGPPSPTQTLQRRIARYLSPPLFPVHIADIPSKPIFHDAPTEEWTIGGARILAAQISHSGPTLGYRISENGRSLAYMPDHEPVRAGDLSRLTPDWISGYQIARGADLLLHDSQYTEEEYPSKVGWGHSSVAHVVAYGKATGVKQLMLFHHDPMHNDDALDEKLARARELWGASDRPPELAREGGELEIA